MPIRLPWPPGGIQIEYFGGQWPTNSPRKPNFLPAKIGGCPEGCEKFLLCVWWNFRSFQVLLLSGLMRGEEKRSATIGGGRRNRGMAASRSPEGPKDFATSQLASELLPAERTGKSQRKCRRSFISPKGKADRSPPPAGLGLPRSAALVPSGCDSPAKDARLVAERRPFKLT